MLSEITSGGGGKNEGEEMCVLGSENVKELDMGAVEGSGRDGG